MAHYKVPGVSVAVTVDRKIAWAKGYGVLEAQASKAVDSDTLFQAASISKPVSAAGALRLVEQGKLRLDAPVNDQLERWKVPDNEYTAKRAVTLRHLLSHQAGTTVHGFPGYAKDAPVPTLIQVLNGESPANTKAVVVDKIPGESFRYSGGGTTIVQLLIEDGTDQSFSNFMSAQVLAPLGMTRSHFRHPVIDANAARAHIDEDSIPVVGHSHTYPELAAAGLWATPTDLSTFALEIVDSLQGEDDAFLSVEMAREMLTPLDDDYGLGFGIVKAEDGVAFGHNGGNHGFKCRLFTYTDGRGGFAIMTNADSGSQLIREIAGAIAATYGWQLDAAKELEAVTLSSEAMQRIAGAYYLNPNDEDSRIQISVADNVMWIEAPFFARTRFYATSDSSFFVTVGHEIELEKDASGRSIAIVIKGGPRAIRKT
jgi:CubicO group peptidase (beta-lactamase class C family)